MTPTLVASRTFGGALPLSPEKGTNFPGGGPSENCVDLSGGTDVSALLDERVLSKLKWRCRRGLLENDLLIEKFFARHEATLTVRQAKGLNDLMELSDNDLLDLLLRRKEPPQLLETNSQASASTFEALEVLNLLRPAASGAVTVHF